MMVKLTSLPYVEPQRTLCHKNITFLYILTCTQDYFCILQDRFKFVEVNLNTALSICTLKGLLVSAIVPAVHTDKSIVLVLCKILKFNMDINKYED